MGLLTEVLYAVVITVIPIIASNIVKYLSAKKLEIEQKSESNKKVSDVEVFNNTLVMVIELIQKTVDTVSQTYVDRLKKEGKFTKESQEIAFDRAKDSVKSLLDTRTRDILSSVYSDLDKWIEIQIESYIKSSKIVES